MKTDVPVITRLRDYKAPSFKIETVNLDFKLDPTNTRVRSVMAIHRTDTSRADLHLDGEDIKLVSIKVDGKPFPKSRYKISKTEMVISGLDKNFTLEIETICNPSANTSLMGLYVSGGRFCTQCEAEGFRRITYFPDRPDMLATYKVRIEADKNTYPILIANGNCIDEGDMAGGKHFAVWEDPFPKPCYLFALVAGKFDIVNDSFTTMSGRNIPLDIYVDLGDAPRALYAMDALKRSMKWDEDAFGREYDLDRFMVVAVRDFNFGAMENKGLNIFNSSLLLADEASATDMNFELIESVIAHEYFHNWTGNRITCRDWFQLCLKEGFTVFRDQEFSADQRGAAQQRIKDVKALRARQFPEDAGPLAHPVRPASYMKIDNFYTATIYEKGAELIRMLKTLLGDEAFRKGCGTYFETLDGTAATIEQFIACFEKASGKDLSQFMLWYEQAGTPKVKITTHYDAKKQTYDIHFAQTTAPTPGQKIKKPVLMPIKMALLGDGNNSYGEQIFELDTSKASLHYQNVTAKPVLSVFRGFSAPVIINYKQNPQDALIQMRQDSDLFNRWEAGQAMAANILIGLSGAIETGAAPNNHKTMELYANALVDIAADTTIDAGFKALALSPPGDGAILQAMYANDAAGADPLAIRQAIKMMRRAIAEKGQAVFTELYTHLSEPEKFIPDAKGAGRRALRNTCLMFLSEIPRSNAQSLAKSQFDKAANMTEELAALITLVRLGGETSKHALQSFYDKWEQNPLVIDKWFGASSLVGGKNALANISALTKHPAYIGGNPNRVRSLIGGFAAGNPEIFHNIDGSGYRFFTDNVRGMDTKNPQVAARLLGMFSIWKILDPIRRSLIKEQLFRIISGNPSPNVLEIATKSLGD